MPRWVKVLAVVIAVLAVAVIAHRFLGGGEHGPGSHAQSGALGIFAPPLAGDSVG
jgi:hypothetical protein